MQDLPQNLIVIFYLLTGNDNDHMDGAMGPDEENINCNVFL